MTASPATALGRGSPESLILRAGPAAGRDEAGESGEAARGGGDDLPHVRHLNERHENVGPVGAHPETLDAVVTGRDEFAIINPRAVRQGHSHVAALETPDAPSDPSAAYGGSR